MAKTRLKSADGSVEQGSFGADITSGTTLDAGEIYLVIGVDDAASDLPAGISAGYVFKAAGTELLAGDDIVKLYTGTSLCDIKSVSFDFSKGEIEATTLCDDQKKYLVGKSDATGSMEGIYEIGISDSSDGVQNRFVDIATIAAAGSFSLSELSDDLMYIRVYTQDDSTSGETVEFYFAPINLTTFNQGVSVDDNAQTFTAGFRIAPDTANGVKVCYYKEVIA